MKDNYLLNSIEYLKGVGPNRSILLKSELKIFTIEDLINFYPYRYIDRTKFYKISELINTTSYVQIIGRFIDFKYSSGTRNSRLVGIFSDGEDQIDIIWFKGQKWIEKTIDINKYYIIYGKLNFYNNKFSIPHPEIEIFDKFKKKKQNNLIPVYSSSEKLNKRGINNKLFRELITNIFSDFNNNLKENLNRQINEKHNLITKYQALYNIHFPKNQILLKKAQFRLKYEEFFFIQLQFFYKNIDNKNKFKGFLFSKVGIFFNTFFHKNLKFELTNAQKRVVKEIRKDFSSNTQMNRLLQGDVGSGKTIVALLSALIAIDNGFQTCLVAPTEILAQQHFNSITEALQNLNIQVKILTGSTKNKDRVVLFEELKKGTIDILVGTHAVFEDNVVFKNIGLAIIDEQHRFGVEQRSKLWKKNSTPPHVLVMTATPIPRTLAMSVYGDLDISTIDRTSAG